jgi:hypothetical protein
MLWLKSKNESIRVTNPLFVKPEEKRFSNLTETLKRFAVICSKFIELKELKIKIVTYLY